MEKKSTAKNEKANIKAHVWCRRKETRGKKGQEKCYHTTAAYFKEHNKEWESYAAFKTNIRDNCNIAANNKNINKLIFYLKRNLAEVELRNRQRDTENEDNRWRYKYLVSQQIEKAIFVNLSRSRFGIQFKTESGTVLGAGSIYPFFLQLCFLSLSPFPHATPPYSSGRVNIYLIASQPRRDCQPPESVANVNQTD